MKLITTLKVNILSASLLFSTTVFATGKPNFNIKEFTLPSEVKDMNKSYGSVFFSPSVKGKVLIPVHFWGEVKNSGLHFVPVNTTFLNGLSMAGGPSSTAKLDNVRLTRKNADKFKVLRYDISDGGNTNVYAETLQPGDSVFIPKDQYLENRAYYTGLIGVFATVLSSILLYRQVKSD
ncbi:SLBB domain-containing protein [Bacteriovorax sp. DB6_IX]|uniref:SLBB domain-containing protein n=1 Tax=Bacteriovorax sp. DB6_IX TaxID=1353530 RepID=UPI00038A035D|nr:SLBB domain-containing protein [Bacteriovorax sp. DB6_IX]EQC52808.1 SLBB domain protein [Bacteriovorax sp. DB6_IX]